MRSTLLLLLLAAGIGHAIAADEGQFPWSIENQCELKSYSPVGIFPTMKETLRDLDLEHRFTRGFDPKKESWNYHQADYIHEGVSYSAAIDISTRCLSHEQIKELLGELAIRGFAAWLREKGKDGWNGSKHIHAVWASAKLKVQLSNQIENWMIGRNGLASDLEYKFWNPNEEQKYAVLTAYKQAN